MSEGAGRQARSPEPGPVPGCPAEPGEGRFARLARGCRPRGCRAPARRVHGRRVRYVIGDEPGQVNGMRWRGGRPRRPSGIIRDHL
ncbi:tryptophan biosynthesis modulator TrpM [Streptomyces fragilis]|uniref:tryptophan biosynthesis modulator TrpM n=1 Tax=Streptomyces fragilis TaxID=67301 RepID=UPI0035576B7D